VRGRPAGAARDPVYAAAMPRRRRSSRRRRGAARAALEGRFRRIGLLGESVAMLQWDMAAVMPEGGAAARGEQMAELREIAHELLVADEVGEWLDRAREEAQREGADAWHLADLREMERDRRHAVAVPAALVARHSRAASACEIEWRGRRDADDFAGVLPSLREVLGLVREIAAAKSEAFGTSPYDALLDEYEPGGRWRAIAERFAGLRAGLVPLVQACAAARRRPDDTVLCRPYPVDAQRRFVTQVAERIGFDFHRGRLDTTAHPFCSSMGPDDCRITTRWDERFLPTALFGVLHEAGHGLYEQGLRREWYGLPPGEAASLGIHEAQSRLWENLVGRSRPFWEWCFPQARAAFPEALGDTDAAAVHEALLTVKPSFIRVEADEVTYNLHVMLRFDLERAVIQGDLPIGDLPAAWDERFEQDFGRRPTCAAEGVLQDIHWSAGLIGYFPTYALGNMYAAQLMAAAEEQVPDLEAGFAAGAFGDLLGWLRREVHAAGRLLESEPLVAQVTGRPVSEAALLESLRRRYGPVHGLETGRVAGSL